MMKKKYLKIGFVIRMLTIVFATGLILNIFIKNPVRIDVQLRLSIQTDQEGVYELFVNNKIQRLSVKKGDNDLVFKLPKKTIEQIRLKFAQKGAFISIRKIQIRSFVKSVKWEHNLVTRLISTTHKLKKTGPKKSVSFFTESKESYLVLAKQLYPVINKLSQQKILNYFFILLILLLVIFLLYNFDYKQIIKFLSFKNKGYILVLFLVFLFLPLVNHWFGLIRPLAIIEKRAPIQNPEFRLDPLHDYIELYIRYFNNYNVYRSYSIFLNNFVKIKFFEKSPVDKVILGKEKWLFMAREANRDLISFYRNRESFKDSELKRWAKILTERKNWLKKKGIGHIFVIVPNKNTVYPDFMPGYINKVQEKSKLDQINEYLKDKTDINVIDLREVLNPKKAKYPLYDRTDSHWNDYGGYLAYSKIIGEFSRYFPGLKPIPLNDFKFVKLNENGGDLAIMLALQNKLFRENKIRLKYKKQFQANYGQYSGISGWSPWIKKTESTNLKANFPKVMVVHDSFMHQVKPFFSEHFKKVIYVWDWTLNFFDQIIEREMPTIVLEEITERALVDLKLINPEL